MKRNLLGQYPLPVALLGVVAVITAAVVLTSGGDSAEAQTGTPTATLTASTTSSPAASATPGSSTSSTPRATASPAVSPAATLTPSAVGGTHHAFKAADSVFRREQYAAGQEIVSQGMFFLDPDTGAVEGWTLETSRFGDGEGVYYQVSDDNRYVVTPEDGYILNRKTGRAFSWDPSRTTYVTAWQNRTLFRQMDHYLLLDGEMRLVNNIAIQAGVSVGDWRPLVSPDGSKLVFAASGAIALVDLQAATPSLRLVGGQVPEGARGQQAQTLRLVAEGKEIALIAHYRPLENTESSYLSVRRFAWDGTLLSEVRLPGSAVWFSPDGNLLAWETSVRFDGFGEGFGGVLNWPAVVVGDAKGNPLFRLKGATLCYSDEQAQFGGGRSSRRWAADGSGLVLSARDGAVLVSVRDRTLQPLRIGDFPQPAPGRAGVFAVGRTRLVTLGGAALTTPPKLSFSLSPAIDPWGNSADELRFANTGFEAERSLSCGIPASGPPRVESLPFPSTATHLRVAAQGDCLNQRSLPSPTAPVVACIADKSLLEIVPANFSPYTQEFLAVGPPPTAPGKCGVGIASGDSPPPPPVSAYQGWVHVRTANGVEGWVSSQYLDWAD